MAKNSGNVYFVQILSLVVSILTVVTKFLNSHKGDLVIGDGGSFSFKVISEEESKTIVNNK